LQVETSKVKTSNNDIDFMAQPRGRQTKRTAEVGQISATEIAEFNVLQITSNTFVRIQIGRVTGQVERQTGRAN
jgi:hypothetical protein